MFHNSVTWFISNMQSKKILIAQKAFTKYRQRLTHVWNKKQNLLLRVVALCARMHISIHTHPMLRITVSFPQAPSSPLPSSPQSTPSPHGNHTCDTL
jgi:hypothetical protein